MKRSQFTLIVSLGMMILVITLTAQNRTKVESTSGTQIVTTTVIHQAPGSTPPPPVSDSDNNGLPDAWERQHFGGIGVDLDGDPDGDGRNNLQEYQQGSDPNVSNEPKPAYAVIPLPFADEILTWTEQGEVLLVASGFDASSNQTQPIYKRWSPVNGFTDLNYAVGPGAHSPYTSEVQPHRAIFNRKGAVALALAGDDRSVWSVLWPSGSAGAQEIRSQNFTDIRRPGENNQTAWVSGLDGQGRLYGRYLYGGEFADNGDGLILFNGDERLSRWDNPSNPPTAMAADIWAITAVNDAGTMVGAISGFQGFVGTGETLLAFYPHSINSEGVVLGFSYPDYHLWRNGASVLADWPLDVWSWERIDDSLNLIGRDSSGHQVIKPLSAAQLAALFPAKTYVNPALPAGWASDWLVDKDDTRIQFSAGTFTDTAVPNAAPATKRFLAVRAELAVDNNRDGIIELSNEDSSDATSSSTPNRFWSNDDDDQGPADGDDIPGRALNKADYNNAVVDSVRDLVDFFPVFLDIKQLLTVLPHTTAGITYKLKQADGALNFVYTNKTRAQAFDHQKQILTTGFGPAFTQAAGVAATQQITAAGVELNTAFLDGIKITDWGVILIEGRVATTAPLRLVVEKGGTEIAEVALNIRISPVEEMFRHVNLTGTPKNYDNTNPSLPETPEATRTGVPINWPDTQTNGKYFVFLHGYNVDAQKARGWQAEVFKRLHAMGSKARFVGVTWHGATGLDYHRAVFHAFQTGDVLAGALSFTGNADVTIAGHSLGNMVVSHAIQAGGLSPARYYIINGATPLEAYAVNDAGPGEAANMTELAWRTYDSRLYMANWHALYAGTSDNRKALTWKNLFASVRTRAETHNFYSEEEDVVTDADQNTSASIMATLLNQGFNVSLGAWKAQELVKGVDWTTSLASVFMIRGQAGWEFNLNDWYTMTNPPGPPSQEGVPVKNRLTPNEAAVLLSPDRIEELETKPFFDRFMEPALMSADTSTASTKAGEAWVRYDLFARGIPAMSNATAANFMLSLDNARNFPMHTAGKVAANGPFPTNARGDWRHSDFKDVGLPYVYLMYQAMIDRGGLN